MLKSLLFAAPIALMSAAAQAAPGTLYDCTLDAKRDEWLPKQILVFIEDGNKSAKVLDGFIQSSTGDWQEAKISEVSNVKTALNWTVLYSYGGRSVRISFRWAGFADGKATMSSKLVGYTNQDNSRGTCTKEAVNL